MRDYFNPHFLSLTFETLMDGKRETIEEFVHFNPHFLSLTFETLLERRTTEYTDIFQSSFSEFDL